MAKVSGLKKGKLSEAELTEKIKEKAKELWEKKGRVQGQDQEIWLEAERQLSTLPAETNTPSAAEGRGNGNAHASRTATDPKAADLKPGASARTEHLRGQMASESEGEFQITPAIPDNDAIKAALQVREARAPIHPGKNAPQAKPTESGKPLWNKPHSS